MMSQANLTIPRGRIIFGRFSQNSYAVEEWVDLGNCPTFSMSVNYSSVKGIDSINGQLVESENYITGRSANFRFETDNLSKLNISTWMNAHSRTHSPSGNFVKNTQYFNPVNGGIFVLNNEANSTPSVENADTGSNLVKDIDFRFDAEFNAIYFQPHVNFRTKVVYYSFDSIDTFGQSPSGRAVEGELRFVSNNPIGLNIKLRLPRVCVEPADEFTLIGDPTNLQWSKLSFDVEVLMKQGENFLFTLQIPQTNALEYQSMLLSDLNGSVYSVTN